MDINTTITTLEKCTDETLVELFFSTNSLSHLSLDILNHRYYSLEICDILNLGCKIASHRVVDFALRLGEADLKKALYHAYSSGNRSMIERITNILGETDLVQAVRGACKGGHTFLLNRLIEEEGLERKKDFNFENLFSTIRWASSISNIAWGLGLIKACKYGKIDTVQYIYKTGYKLDKICIRFVIKYMTTPEHMEIFKLAIKDNTEYYEYALNKACKHNRIDVVHLILSKIVMIIHDSSQEIELNLDMNKILSRACYESRYEIVDILHDFDQHVNSDNLMDWDYGLLYACLSENKDMINKLITIGASDWESCMKSCCSIGDSLEIIQYIYSKMDNVSSEFLNECIGYMCRNSDTDRDENLTRQIREQLMEWGATGCSNCNGEATTFEQLVEYNISMFEQLFEALANEEEN